MNRTVNGYRSIAWFVYLCLVLFLPTHGAAQTFFRDVTEEQAPWLVSLLFSRSIAFGDYNNDGWADAFVSESYWSTGGRIVLLRNEGDGRFADRTADIQAEIPTKTKGGGAIFGDYDNDGDLDLYVPIGQFFSVQSALNVLLRNDRGVFRDVTVEASLTDELPSDNAIWLDYNRDGHLDLYVANLSVGWPVGENDPTTRNKLYRNNGDGTFADVTREAGLDIQLNPETGGSNGGMAAGDFNDDGWPDLYVGVFLAPNRLFLNDGQGGFRDATTSEIGDPGEAFGIAIGDIDNDGDLDIFQAAGGSGEAKYRSSMLLNVGEGQFLDVTPGAELSGLLAVNVVGTGLADIDNDGDVDLLTSSPHFLYLNNGDGTFVDGTSQSGIVVEGGSSLSFGDMDLDGFLDACIGKRLFRNTGNTHHWLRVELVGIRSNRSGIGARLIATSGDLTQMREILGGLGYTQDELVAHFGLGSHTQVDRLEIRWPSGEVDVLRNIPADQKIRVFEGREEAHVTHPTLWEHTIPHSSVIGEAARVEATVYPTPFEPEAEIVRIIADLSNVGGPSNVPLTEVGENAYRLEHTVIVGGVSGLRPVSVMVEQETSLGLYWTTLSKTITVLPAVLPSEDMVIYEDGLGAGWSVEPFDIWRTQVGSDLTSSRFVHSGTFSHAISLPGLGDGGVQYVFTNPEGIDPSVYSHLEFYIYGEDLSGENILIGDKILLQELGVEPQPDTWTLVRVPMSEPELALDQRGRLTRIVIIGWGQEAFYIDDMKLVVKPITEVEALAGNALPSGYALFQNVPNPFNPITTIAYDLPQASDVTLTLYTITGQKVATLMSGYQAPGHHEVRWDGSGFGNSVYFYRLEAGEFMETRRMVLIK